MGWFCFGGLKKEGALIVSIGKKTIAFEGFLLLCDKI